MEKINICRKTEKTNSMNEKNFSNFPYLKFSFHLFRRSFAASSFFNSKPPIKAARRRPFSNRWTPEPGLIKFNFYFSFYVSVCNLRCATGYKNKLNSNIILCDWHTERQAIRQTSKNSITFQLSICFIMSFHIGFLWALLRKMWRVVDFMMSALRAKI